MVKLPDSISWKDSILTATQGFGLRPSLFTINALVAYHKSIEVTSQPFESQSCFNNILFHTGVGGV